MIFVTSPPSSSSAPPGYIAWEDDGEYLTRLGEGSHNGWYNPEIKRRLLKQNEWACFHETEYETISRHLAMGRKLRPVL
jgi:hypothetical protein